MIECRLINEFKDYFSVSGIDDNHIHNGEGTIGPVSPEMLYIDGNTVGCVDLRKESHTVEGYVELAYLYIYKQKNGYGTLVMEKICELADKYSLEVELDAVPIDSYGETINMGKLKSFYRSFGFKHSNVRGSNKMTRCPKS